MQLQKIPILSPQKGLEFSWGVQGSVRPKNLKKCMKLYWNFQRGGGSTRQYFRGGGMDVFWNYTFTWPLKPVMLTFSTLILYELIKVSVFFIITSVFQMLIKEQLFRSATVR